MSLERSIYSVWITGQFRRVAVEAALKAVVQNINFKLAVIEEEKKTLNQPAVNTTGRSLSCYISSAEKFVKSRVFFERRWWRSR